MKWLEVSAYGLIGFVGLLGSIVGLLGIADKAMGQVPAGYKTRAQINACTLQGCQSQTWFLRNSAWCGKTADGWSPTQGTGKLSVTCRRPL